VSNVALKKENRILLGNCRVANSFFTRFLGLMGKKGIASDEAVVFPRCNSIHTFFMRFPIDVIFVGETGEVVEIFSALKPWRLLLPQRGAKHVVEMGPGRAGQLGIGKGSRLECEGVWG
jgi:uncharacterized membrane protein (UPF0127 family)